MISYEKDNPTIMFNRHSTNHVPCARGENFLVALSPHAGSQRSTSLARASPLNFVATDKHSVLVSE